MALTIGGGLAVLLGWSRSIRWLPPTLAGIAEHVKKFWESRMRAQILASLDGADGAGISDIVRAALTTHRALLQPA